MDERDMEEEGKNGKGWGIEIKMYFFLESWFLWFLLCNHLIGNPKAVKANKAYSKQDSGANRGVGWVRN
jgi:hypothetical protein